MRRRSGESAGAAVSQAGKAGKISLGAPASGEAASVVEAHKQPPKKSRREIEARLADLGTFFKRVATPSLRGE